MIRFLWNSVLTGCNYEHELKTISIEMFNSSYELNKSCCAYIAILLIA